MNVTDQHRELARRLLDPMFTVDDGTNNNPFEQAASLIAQSEALAVQKAAEDRDMVRHALRAFMEGFEVYDLSNETHDEISKRSEALWGIVKERDALKAELALLRSTP